VNSGHGIGGREEFDKNKISLHPDFVEEHCVRLNLRNGRKKVFISAVSSLIFAGGVCR
jgi:hypothetical protein